MVNFRFYCLIVSPALFMWTLFLLTPQPSFGAETWRQAVNDVFTKCSNDPDAVRCYNSAHFPMDPAIMCHREKGYTIAESCHEVDNGLQEGPIMRQACNAAKNACRDSYAALRTLHQERLAKIVMGRGGAPSPCSTQEDIANNPSFCSSQGERVTSTACTPGDWEGGAAPTEGGVAKVCNAAGTAYVDFTEGYCQKNTEVISGRSDLAQVCICLSDGGETGTCLSSASPAQVADSSARSAASGSGNDSSDSVDPSEPVRSEDSDPSSVSEGSTGPESCQLAYTTARDCCSNPIGCLMSSDKETAQNVQAGIGLVMQGGQMYSGMQQQQAQMNGQPSTAMCDFMNTAGNASAGINMAGAAICQQKKALCFEACGKGSEQCRSFNAQIAAQAIQGISSALAASIANQCQDMTAQSNGLTPSDIEFMPDCSDPANTSNPNCNGECSGPDAASNPFCKSAGTGSGGGGAGTSYATDQASYGDNGTQYDSNPDLLEGIGSQENLGFGAEGQAQANAIEGGGGGGMGSGVGGASLGDGQRGKSQGGGYNTNVLKGASGGGGYVGPSTGSVGVSSGSGGFRGYGRAAGKVDDDTIDLKQFLPGGKKDPRKRTVAGLSGGAAAQIGRKETNIFQTMSVKYRQMCQLKRMWDCPKLSSSGIKRSR